MRRSVGFVQRVRGRAAEVVRTRRIIKPPDLDEIMNGLMKTFKGDPLITRPEAAPLAAREHGGGLGFRPKSAIDGGIVLVPKFHKLIHNRLDALAIQRGVICGLNGLGPLA
ncbi:MAG: hypothetical protein NVSMB14_00320 [Isosphaeraceae bacterium]